MKHITPALLLGLSLVGIAQHTNAQAPLSALGTSTVIDFSTTVPGVNNGLFDAQAPVGDVSPATGQLDYDGWNYLSDGTAADAAQGAANFPGAMPDGNGLGNGGSLVGGINAVDIGATHALAIQPTGSNWTSGSLTLRAQNNTGGPLEQLDVAFSVFVFNDADRSNSVRFYYSLTAAADSWVEVTSAAVISPDTPDASPDWVEHPVAFTLGGFSINSGDIVYLRWVGDDISGSGTRDEFAFSNISLTPEAITGPSVIAIANGLTPFEQTVGTPGTAQNFTVTGSNLTDDVTITAPAPFEVSANEASGYAGSMDVVQTGGTLDPTTIYVRLNSATAGPFAGVITIATPGAASSLVGVSGTAASGSLPTLFLNELMASNSSTITDENGEYDDWFEIYNPNSDAVDLSGWYTSDDPADPAKYQFPIGGTEAIVPADGFLLVWADNQTAQGDLHTNFSLSASGESLLLTAPDGITVVDSISFGPQSADISYGREYDGQLPWITFDNATPGSSNHPLGITEQRTSAGLRAWPNPVSGDLLHFDRPVTGEVLGIDGRVVASTSHALVLSTAALCPGSYVLRTSDGTAVRFMIP